MKIDSLEVFRLNAPFGAGVQNFSFKTPNRRQAALLHSLLAQHHLLVFTDLDEPLALGDLNAFFADLGDLSVNTDEVKEHWARLRRAAKFDPDSPAINYVSNVIAADGKPVGLLGDAELDWHNDHAPLTRVKKIGGLQAIEIDDGAPPTCFCDMYAALDTLEPPMRTLIDDRIAVHVDFALAAHKDASGHAAVPAVQHAVVKNHPDSRRPTLFVNRSTTERIAGVDAARSKQLLDDLFGHAYQERFMYAHEWRKHQFVVWDNLGLQHRRDSPMPGVKRTLLKFPGVAE